MFESLRSPTLETDAPCHPCARRRRRFWPWGRCHAADGPVVRRGDLVVVLAGNPNSGKTTLFNALTGLRHKVANYPGVTVETKSGRARLPDSRHATVIDLPGTYSLVSRSPDETLAMQVLRGLRDDTPAPDVIVVVVDASNLQRNLYLVSQVIELGRPLVIALNMMDVAQRRGISIDVAALTAQLGVPVVQVVAHKRQGIDQLRRAIVEARVAPMPDWPLPDAMKEELVLVGGGLAILDGHAALPRSAGGVGFASPTIPEPHMPPVPGAAAEARFDQLRLDRYRAIAERLLIGDRAADLDRIATQQPVSTLLDAATQRMLVLGIDPMQADIEAHYRWIESVADRSVGPSSPPVPTSAKQERSGPSPAPAHARRLSDRLDSILVHRLWGLVTFVLIMGALFVSLFLFAQPIMDAFRDGIQALGHATSGLLPEGPLRDLVNDGVFNGVGAVIVFVPQIALLFLFLGILEDSGYLARAAFLMDRLLSKVGLHGKSFIPLLSSFACAIPGIMATRTIENRKDRLATILVAPFMSCSARLPVYALLIGAFFGHCSSLTQALIMLALYVLGIGAAAGIAFIFRRTLLRGAASAFILEMPSYKLPQPAQIARHVASNTWAFLAKAGTIIFCLSILLWAMTYYPRLPADRAAQFADDNARAQAQLQHSFAGRFGHAIEPVIRPLGYDWKIGVGLVGAFAAREVFVSTMGIIYSVGDASDQTQDLALAMRSDMGPDGQPVWTPLVAVSLMVWFVLAMQCMSTLAIVRRETASWRWPLFMLLYMNGLAYVASLLIYQVGRALA